MSTVLFLDDRYIAKLTNLAPTLGEPELLSVFRDPNASNYVGWGMSSPTVSETRRLLHSDSHRVQATRPSSARRRRTRAACSTRATRTRS